MLRADPLPSINVPLWRIILRLNQSPTYVRLPEKDHYLLLFVSDTCERSSHLSIFVHMNKVPAPVSVYLYVPLKCVIIFIVWDVGVARCVARKNHRGAIHSSQFCTLLAFDQLIYLHRFPSFSFSLLAHRHCLSNVRITCLGLSAHLTVMIYCPSGAITCQLEEIYYHPHQVVIRNKS